MYGFGAIVMEMMTLEPGSFPACQAGAREFHEMPASKSGHGPIDTSEKVRAYVDSCLPLADKTIPDAWRQALKACLDPNPGIRPSAKQLKQLFATHPLSTSRVAQY